MGHSGSLGLLVLYDRAVGLFAQARDAAWREEEEEHADYNLRKVPTKRRKKGLSSSTKMDFMRLRTDSYLALIKVYLFQSSKQIHMTSDMFDLSNAKHQHRNAVLHCEWWCGEPATSLPNDVMGSTPKTWLNGLALSHI